MKIAIFAGERDHVDYDVNRWLEEENSVIKKTG